MGEQTSSATVAWNDHTVQYSTVPTVRTVQFRVALLGILTKTACSVHTVQYGQYSTVYQNCMQCTYSTELYYVELYVQCSSQRSIGNSVLQRNNKRLSLRDSTEFPILQWLL